MSTALIAIAILFLVFVCAEARRSHVGAGLLGSGRQAFKQYGVDRASISTNLIKQQGG